MPARHVPVDLGRKDGLVAAARDLTRQAGEKRQCVIDLRIRQRAAVSLETSPGRSAIDAVEERGIVRRRNRRKITALLIVTGKKEQPVLQKRAASCGAELITRVDRFQRDLMSLATDHHALKSARIARAPRVVAIVEKG